MFDSCSPFIQSYYFVLPNAHKSILRIFSIQFHCFGITLSILNEFSLTKITITLNVLDLGNFWIQLFNNFSIPGWAGGKGEGMPTQAYMGLGRLCHFVLKNAKSKSPHQKIFNCGSYEYLGQYLLENICLIESTFNKC